MRRRVYRVISTPVIILLYLAMADTSSNVGSYTKVR